MKKLLLFFIAIFVLQVSDSQAQIEKSKILIGASTAFSVTGNNSGSNIMSLGYLSGGTQYGDDGNSSNSNSFNLYVNPKVGYFLTDNFAIGADFSFSYLRSKSTSDNINRLSKQTLIAAGPFVRYYFPIKSLIPFAEVNGAYGVSAANNGSDAISFDEGITLLNIGGGLGLAFPINNKATFDLMVAYNYQAIDRSNSDAKEDHNSISVELGFNIFLGN